MKEKKTYVTSCVVKICYITCRTESKCNMFVGIFSAKFCMEDVISDRHFLLSQLLPIVTFCVHMLRPIILKDKHNHWDIYSLLGSLILKIWVTTCFSGFSYSHWVMDGLCISFLYVV